jgi:hypothetical protein
MTLGHVSQCRTEYFGSEPFESSEWRVLGFIQDLLQSNKVGLLPGLLRQVHIGRIEMPLRDYCFRVRAPSLLASAARAASARFWAA